jgi:hypothetical protein
MSVGRSIFKNEVQMHTQKLRLGLLLDSFNVPAWVYSVLQRVANEKFGEFVLVVLNEDAGKANKKDIG